MGAEPVRKTAYSPRYWMENGMAATWLGFDLEQIGRQLQIAPSTAHRIFSQFRRTGNVSVHAHPRREESRKLNNHHEIFIMAVIHENPCLYLREICQAIYKVTGVTVSGSTVCRVLRRNGFTRKKVQQIAQQKYIDFRAAFMAQVLQFPRDFFVWVDETGSDERAHIQRFGYSLLGLPPVYIRLLARGKNFSDR